MIGSDEFDTSHAECFSAVKATLDSGCKLIVVLTETDHTVLLIDKYWLQAAILVMSSSETTVRQLQCERSDEILVLAAFLCADSVIQGASLTGSLRCW